jgi:hypothetical protein
MAHGALKQFACGSMILMLKGEQAEHEQRDLLHPRLVFLDADR